MAEASLLKRQTGSGQVKWCLHTHFDVEKYIPDRIDVTPNAGGEHDERAVLQRVLERDRLYVRDRGYAKFALFNAIVKHDSSSVCRLRDNSVYEIAEERPLTDADRQVQGLSDQIVRIGLSGKAANQPAHPVRLVIVKIKPQVVSGNSRGVDSDGFLRIRTNLLDVPAEIIALLDEHCGQIEVFFRTFKHLLGCRHLLSHHPDGIKIQTYCAIIAGLLINLWTGRQPTKRTHEMLCDYLMGWADEDELLAHLTKLETRDAATSRSPRGRGVHVLGVRVTWRCAEISATTLSDASLLVPRRHLRDSVHSTEPIASAVPNTIGASPQTPGMF